MMDDKKYILLPTEIDAFVESLEKFDICSIGSPRWFSQHERVCKLSMQAVLSAISGEEEVVKESMISLGQLPVVIHELIITETWKEKVFPEIFKMAFQPTTTIPLYMVLYHEAMLISLLETIFFHQEAIEAAEDVIIDLIDYCHCKVVCFINSCTIQEPFCDQDISTSINGMEELLKQNDIMSYEIGIKAVSLLSFMAQHLKSLPLSALHRILTIHDIPLVLIGLINKRPWHRILANGDVEKYYDGKWNKVYPENFHKLSKLEGQIWIALIQLLLDPECRNKYDINDYKKEEILKIGSQINEAVIDQIPPLKELLRFLEHLSVFYPPPSKPDIIIEQVSELREKLLKYSRKQWSHIAKEQSKAFFSISGDQLKTLLDRLADVYSMDHLEAVLPGLPVCAKCGLRASKRCSQCRIEWYCQRECQVKHWPKHKSTCTLVEK